MSASIDFSSLTLATAEAFVAAKTSTERRAVVEKLTPGSDDQVYLLTILAEQEGFPDDILAQLTGMSEDFKVSRQYKKIRTIERMQSRRALASGGAGDAEADASMVKVLRQAVSPGLSHAKVTASRGEEAAAAFGPPVMPEDVTAALSVSAQLEAVRGRRSDADRASTSQSWVNKLSADAGLIEDPAARAFLADSADRKLALREAVLSCGLPLGADRVRIVGEILAANPEDRSVAVDERNLAGMTGSTIMALLFEDRSRPRVQPRARELYTQLCLEELQELRRRGAAPHLGHDDAWVSAVLARLGPAEGTCLDDSSPAAEDAYVDAVSSFVDTLPPMRNTLRAWVHFQRCRLAEERTGSFADARDALLSLLRLPLLWSGSKTDKASARLLSTSSSLCESVRLAQGPGAGFPLCMPARGADVESLLARAVRELATADAGALAAAGRELSTEFAARLTAEAHLLAGDTGREWTSALSEGALSSLRTRQTLRFASTRTYFGVDEAAVVRLRVKNVGRLSISLFELNTTAIYRETGAEIRTDMELEGLVPAVTEQRPIDRSPFHEAVEEIALPALAEARRGVWVLEVVGAGQRARCVIRKGALRLVSAVTTAGHAFRVLDESNRPLPLDGVSLWMGGNHYRPEAVEHPAAFASPERLASQAASTIVIPFTGSSPSTKTVVATLSTAPAASSSSAAASSSAASAPRDWSFSSLHSFRHAREEYSLDCAWVLERQALVRDNRTATVLLRPSLSLVGSSGPAAAADLASLEDIKLTVESVDVEDTSATRAWRDLDLTSSAELAVTFAVPNRVRTITFTLECRVEIGHTGAKAPLSSVHTVSLNEIETTGNTADVFLRRGPAGYSAWVLGKTGEPVPSAPVVVRLTSALGDHVRRVDLSTGPDGSVALGPLPNVGHVSVEVQDEAICHGSFTLLADATATAPSFFWAEEGDDAQAEVPHALAPGETGVGRARLVSVIPVPGSPGGHASPLHGAAPGTCIRADLTASCLRFDAATGALVVSGLPCGRYVLLRRGCDTLTGAIASHEIAVRPADGAVTAEAPADPLLAAAFSPTPSLRLIADAGGLVSRPTVPPCRVVAVDATPDALTIRVAGGADPASAVAGARVHVFITHFAPEGEADAHGTTLASGHDSAAREVTTSSKRAQSLYLGSARLGEEHSYVLARQGKEVFPGNSLPRPSLLNTPWSQRTTKSEEVDAAGGEALASRAMHADGAIASRSMARRHGAGGRFGGGGRGTRRRTVDRSFDFLAAPSFLAANLRPGADGTLSVDLTAAFAAAGDAAAAAAFRAAGFRATVVFCDAFTASSRSVDVPADGDAELDTSGSRPVRACYRDLTLQEPLPLDRHFVQTKAVRTLQPGDSASMTAASDTKAEEYGTVEKALRLLATLSGDGRVLGEFSWLGTWHTAPEAERRRLYSKHACHEVNLFLYLKDRPWFDAVVAPFVACKRAKSFIDHFVLGHDLAPFAEPARFALLNALERALLAGRVGAASGSVPYGRDRGSRVRLSPDATEAVFNAAISSNALDDEQDDRLRDALARSRAEQEAAAQPMAAKMAEAAQSPYESDEDEDEDDCMGTAEMASPSMNEAMFGMPSAAPMRSMARAAMPMGAMAMAAPRSGARKSKRASAPRPTPDAIAADEAAMATRRRRQMFRAVDKTEELAETHYWRVRAGRMAEGALIRDSPFWADFAEHQARGDGSAFVSAHFAEATRGINEVLAAVAVLGLPFAMPEPSSVSTGAGRIEYGATASPLVVFMVDISEAESPSSTRVLVGQNFFDPRDRTRHLPDGSTSERYVESGEFLRNKVYGVQVVATNVSSASRDLRVLMQIPQGALPAESGFVTRTRDVRLSAYETRTLEYRFYFPFLGTFGMFPAHVSAGEALEAHAHPTTANVVPALTVVDKTSWAYLANEAPLDECLAYLRSANLQVNGVRLADLAWRCADEAAYRAIAGALEARCEWDAAVVGYAFKHGDAARAAAYALHPSGGAASVRGLLSPRLAAGPLALIPEQGVGPSGGAVPPLSASDLAHISLSDDDRSASGLYEHLEYSPLVNARAHLLGAERRIPNKAVAAQYRRVLASVMHAPADAVSAQEGLALTYHLLLQDRVAEATERFATVDAPAGCAAAAAAAAASSSSSAAAASPASAASSSWCALAYDYMAAYLDFFRPEDGLAVARRVAAAYADYPIPRWAAKFAAVASQLAEIDAADAAAAAGGATRAGKAGQSTSKGGTARGERDEDLGSELVREQQQASASGGEPTLSLELAHGRDPSLRVVASNVDSVEIRYYCMDVELLFSSKPFVSAGGGAGKKEGGFSFVRPNATSLVDVSAGGTASLREVTVPVDTSVGSNLLIEAVAGGKRESVTFFAATLDVEVMEGSGRLRVTNRADGRPIPRVYVKVFGSTSPGGSDDDAFFFKDCYTSATGVADYATVSTDALDRVKRFAILVVSPDHGAVVRTARKPAA